MADGIFWQGRGRNIGLEALGLLHFSPKRFGCGGLMEDTYIQCDLVVQQGADVVNQTSENQ